LLKRIRDLESICCIVMNLKFCSQYKSAISTTISSVNRFHMSPQIRFEGGGEVAVRALEGLHTTVLAHVRIEVPLAISAIVAQRTLETTR